MRIWVRTFQLKYYTEETLFHQVRVGLESSVCVSETEGMHEKVSVTLLKGDILAEFKHCKKAVLTNKWSGQAP